MTRDPVIRAQWRWEQRPTGEITRPSSRRPRTFGGRANSLAAEQAGYTTGDPLSSRREPAPPRVEMRQGFVTRTRYVYAFDGSDDVMKSAAEDLRRRRVRTVGGYAPRSTFLPATPERSSRAGQSSTGRCLPGRRLSPLETRRRGLPGDQHMPGRQETALAFPVPGAPDAMSATGAASWRSSATASPRGRERRARSS
jgi:hypothetical protein